MKKMILMTIITIIATLLFIPIANAATATNNKVFNYGGYARKWTGQTTTWYASGYDKTRSAAYSRNYYSGSAWSVDQITVYAELKYYDAGWRYYAGNSRVGYGVWTLATEQWSSAWWRNHLASNYQTFRKGSVIWYVPSQVVDADI